MRVLVVGATGLIGSALVARLLSSGEEVVGVARDIARASLAQPSATWLSLDLGATESEQWRRHLDGVDAVANCAGTLQDGPGESVEDVHRRGLAALLDGCERAGVRRIVHVSAIGVDRETPSPFSASKRAGEHELMRRDLDWVILRPSVVVGRAAYGGSALFRGLAALPILPVMPQTGPLQVVQLDDVVRAILFFLAPAAPTRRAVDLAGPERLDLSDVVSGYRRWLGRPAARRLALPTPLAGLLYRLGDAAGRLGWRPPLRSTARSEMPRGAVAIEDKAWRLTDIQPKRFGEALAAEPASIQEKWFANLYWLKPLILIVLATFWVITGLLSIGPGYEIGVGLMLEGGAGRLAGPSVIAGGLADIVVGCGIAIRRTTRLALIAALALSLFYAVAGTVLLPRLWLEPLGPLLKIWPIMALHLAALAILRDR